MNRNYQFYKFTRGIGNVIITIHVFAFALSKNLLYRCVSGETPSPFPFFISIRINIPLP